MTRKSSKSRSYLPHVLHTVYGSRLSSLHDLVLHLLSSSEVNETSKKSPARRKPPHGILENKVDVPPGADARPSEWRLIREDDSMEYVSVLKCSYAALSESAPPTGYFALEQRWTQRQVVERVIELIFRQQGGCSNVLCFGYQQPRPGSEFELKKRAPAGLECIFGNSSVEVVDSLPWRLLHSRVGDNFMLYLLSHAAIFHPIPNNCYLQVAGSPLHFSLPVHQLRSQLAPKKYSVGPHGVGKSRNKRASGSISENSKDVRKVLCEGRFVRGNLALKCASSCFETDNTITSSGNLSSSRNVSGNGKRRKTGVFFMANPLIDEDRSLELPDVIYSGQKHHTKGNPGSGMNVAAQTRKSGGEQDFWQEEKESCKDIKFLKMNRKNPLDNFGSAMKVSGSNCSNSNEFVFATQSGEQSNGMSLATTSKEKDLEPGSYLYAARSGGKSLVVSLLPAVYGAVGEKCLPNKMYLNEIYKSARLGKDEASHGSRKRFRPFSWQRRRAQNLQMEKIGMPEIEKVQETSGVVVAINGNERWRQARVHSNSEATCTPTEKRMLEHNNLLQANKRCRYKEKACPPLIEKPAAPYDSFRNDCGKHASLDPQTAMKDPSMHLKSKICSKACIPQTVFRVCQLQQGGMSQQCTAKMFSCQQTDQLNMEKNIKFLANCYEGCDRHTFTTSNFERLINRKPIFYKSSFRRYAGLPKNHILNRLRATKLDALILFRAIFRHSFKLSDSKLQDKVFLTSKTSKCKHLMTVRDPDVVNLLQELISNARRCQYAHLLSRHCPLPMTSCSSSNEKSLLSGSIKVPTLKLKGKVTKSQHLEEGYATQDENCISTYCPAKGDQNGESKVIEGLCRSRMKLMEHLGTPYITEKDHASLQQDGLFSQTPHIISDNNEICDVTKSCKKSKLLDKSYVQQESTNGFSSQKQVVAFIWAVCRRIIPKDLLGSKKNWRALRRNIHCFVGLRRHETFSLKQCLFKLKLLGFPWLQGHNWSRSFCNVHSFCSSRTLLNSAEHPRYNIKGRIMLQNPNNIRAQRYLKDTADYRHEKDDLQADVICKKISTTEARCQPGNLSLNLVSSCGMNTSCNFTQHQGIQCTINGLDPSEVLVHGSAKKSHQKPSLKTNLLAGVSLKNCKVSSTMCFGKDSRKFGPSKEDKQEWNSNDKTESQLNSASSFKSMKRGLRTCIEGPPPYEKPSWSVKQDMIWRNMILGDWIFWVFSDLIVPIIQAHFYVTEGENFRQDVLYYRKPLWAKIKSATLKGFLKSSYRKLSASLVTSLLNQRVLGFSKVRLLPKKAGVRLISNLGAPSTLISNYQVPLNTIQSMTRSKENYQAGSLFANGNKSIRKFESSTMTRGKKRNWYVSRNKCMKVTNSKRGAKVTQQAPKLSEGKTILFFKSVNSVLRDLHLCLKFEQGEHPKDIGCSVYDYNEIYLKLLPFILCMKSYPGGVPPLYFVVCDVARAFDTIKQNELCRILHEFIREDEYLVARFNSVVPTARSLRVNHERFCLSLKKYRNALDLSLHVATKRENSVLIDQVFVTKLKREKILEVLEEHVMGNILQIGQSFFLQLVGIPQGSILSSLLCSIYFGHLEKHRLASFTQSSHVDGYNSMRSVRHGSGTLQANTGLPKIQLAGFLETEIQADVKSCFEKARDSQSVLQSLEHTEETIFSEVDKENIVCEHPYLMKEIQKKKSDARESIINPKHILLRLVDDWLFISSSKDEASQFVTNVHKGFVDYNCIANKHKTSISFDMQQSSALLKMNLYRTEDGARFMRWSGLLINCNTLEIQADYTRYCGEEIKSSLTVWRKNNQGHHLLIKMCQFMRPKCSPLLYDSNINSPATVRLNAYQAFLLCAMKFHAYYCCMPPVGGDNPKFLFEAIVRTTRYMHDLLIQRIRKVALKSETTPLFLLEIKETEWLGLSAFCRILLKKQSRYKKLLSLLEEKIKAPKYKGFDSFPSLKSAMDERRSSMFKYIKY